jgi:hypothetical protein
MSHVVTSGMLIHWALFLGFIFLAAASAVTWLYALGSVMSDTPGKEVPALALYGLPMLAAVWFAVWCVV